MSAVFGHVVNQLRTDTFKDNGFEPITSEEYNIFIKEFVFEKIKGRRLGECFAEKFKVQDRVLYIFSNDDDAIAHIKYCKYVK